MRPETQLQQHEIALDGRAYRVEVLRRAALPAEHPRLVVVAYQPNPLARALLAACLRSLQRFTPEPHELWVVDNHSPGGAWEWLLEEPGLNLILNRSEPLPPGKRAFWREWPVFQRQQRSGSYANAAALELAARVIEPEARYLMPLHMDTLACRSGWLGYLQAQLSERVRAAGVLLHKDRVPEGVLHVLGYLVDFRLFQELGLDFWPRLPALDAGDRVSVGLRAAGYEVFGCRNTYNQPELAAAIPPGSPGKELPVFRALDDQNRVIFMHLSRGVRRTTGEHRRGLSPQEWIDFACQKLLA